MDNVFCNLKNLAYLITKKNERDSIKSENSETLPASLNAYSEKIINELIKKFLKIKKKFENFNFAESFNKDEEVVLAPNQQDRVDLESNLNENISKSRNFIYLISNKINFFLILLKFFIDEVYIGNLITLKCGHNGFYSHDERNLIKEFLSKNNFIL